MGCGAGKILGAGGSEGWSGAIEGAGTALGAAIGGDEGVAVGIEVGKPSAGGGAIPSWGSEPEGSTGAGLGIIDG